MRDKKTTGDEVVPGDVLKLLGEDGLKIMAQMINKCKKLENDASVSLKLQL